MMIFGENQKNENKNNNSEEEKKSKDKKKGNLLNVRTTYTKDDFCFEKVFILLTPSPY